METRLARGSDGGPRRFTEVVPTPHAYSSQWPSEDEASACSELHSVVTRKRPSLNRAGEGRLRLLQTLTGVACRAQLEKS